LESNSKWQIIYDKRNKKYRIVKKQVGLDEYVFYSILNTNITMELGTAVSMVRHFKTFYSVKYKYCIISLNIY